VGRDHVRHIRLKKIQFLHSGWPDEYVKNSPKM
jgi:hypothetical protein